MDWRDNNDINSSNSIIMAKERTPTVVVDDIGIILNTNARGVTDDLVDAANDIVQEMKKRNNYNKIDKNENYNNTDIRFMVTSTLEDAQIATKDIINSSSKKKKKKKILIIPVGGDGTLTSVINLLWKEHIRSNKANNNNKNDNFPFIFGYIAMGTGNALESVIGCRPEQKVTTFEASSNDKRTQGRIRKFLKGLFHPRKKKEKKFVLLLKQLMETTRTTDRGKRKFTRCVKVTS